MNANLIAVILKAKFPNADSKTIENLVDVVCATPNPEIAVETILGVYQQPEIPVQVQDKDNTYTFDHYDRFTGHVYYSYHRPISKWMKYDSSITKEEAEQSLVNGTYTVGDGGNEAHLITTSSEKVNTCCKLSTWMQYKVV
jgi:hypothetical protein